MSASVGDADASMTSGNSPRMSRRRENRQMLPLFSQSNEISLPESMTVFVYPYYADEESSSPSNKPTFFGADGGLGNNCPWLANSKSKCRDPSEGVRGRQEFLLWFCFPLCSSSVQWSLSQFFLQWTY